MLSEGTAFLHHCFHLQLQAAEYINCLGYQNQHPIINPGISIARVKGYF